MPLSLIKDKLYKIGNYTLIVIVFVIVLDNWSVFDLSRIPIPYMENFLYIYLLVNATAAGPYMYLEKKKIVAVGKFCPECDSKLEILKKFHCPNCGNIKIGE